MRFNEKMIHIPENTIFFTKMAGTGNDFIVLDNREQKLTGEEADLFASLCRRRTAIGADGVVLVEKGEKAPVRMRYFNRDGSEAPMCANSARCTAYYAIHRGMVENPKFLLETQDGVHEVWVQDSLVKLRMAPPKDLRTNLGIVCHEGLTEVGFLNTGVPHFVLLTAPEADLNDIDIGTLGPYYRFHPIFEKGTNVNFVQVVKPDRIRVRTFERGVEEETLSCGTGCVASSLLLSRQLHSSSPMLVETRGGDLTVEFDPQWQEVYLIGEVTLVFEGWVYLDFIKI